MAEKFTPLKVEDFDLSPDDLKIIVAGAQTFLSPAEDPEDEDTLDIATP